MSRKAKGKLKSKRKKEEFTYSPEEMNSETVHVFHFFSFFSPLILWEPGNYANELYTYNPPSGSLPFIIFFL